MFYDYSNRVFDPGGTVSIHSTAVGVRRFLSSNIYVDAKSGADFIHTIDDTDTVRPSYSLGLTDELDETSHAGISFTKSYDVNYSSKDLFNSWSVALNWGKQLAQRLYFYTGAFTGAGKFSGGSKENFYGLNLGFDYEIRSNMKAIVGYSFTRRDSSVSGQDYDKNTVTLGMTINF